MIPLDVVTRVLPNGLRALAIPLPHLHTTTLTVSVGAGSRHETPRESGLSHFLEHMVFRGNARFPTPYELNLAIEELGGTVDGATHVDYTLYQLTLPPENVKASLEVLAGILHTPTFGDLEKEKTIVREELLEGLDEDGNDIDVDDVARRLIFGDHPLGQKIGGRPETVDAFTVADLERYLRARYVAGNMVFAVSGQLDPNALLDACAGPFGAFAAGRAEETPGAPSALGAERFAYVSNDGSQSELRLSVPTFGERDPRRATLDVLAGVLDDGMSARVPRRVRDDLGLAYDAFAAPDLYADCGVFDFGATVAHDKAPEAARVLREIAEELATTRIPDRELERVKNRYLFGIRSMADSGAQIAAFHGLAQLFETGETLGSLEAQALSVSADDVRDLAATIFARGQFRLSCVGSLSEKREDEARRVVE